MLRKHIASPRQPFTLDDLRHLMCAAATPVERLVLGLLMDTGLRRSELLAVAGTGIDWRERIIAVDGKGGHPRAMAPGRHTWRLLAAQRNGLGPMLRLSKSGLKRMLDALGKRAGVENVYPHRFRVTMICELLERGVDPIAVGVVAGHSLEMVRYYQRAVEQRRALEQQRRHSLGDRL